ncbi:SGNH/GDSL hydrolase family protein [Rhodopirellula bahusiensis]|uniref:SGNH/GDSL hydrolase family protein n=1 Tax=Rhodopirellula bahusiensis TaxID=2014065 RepID=UPI00326760AA
MTSPSPRSPSSPSKPQLSVRKKILFSFVFVVGVLGSIELLLRVARIGESPAIGVLRFGYDTGIPIFDGDGIEREGEFYQDVPLFEADPNLFWKPIANTPFTGTDGLRLPAPKQQSKRDNTYRIGVIGDSCSFLGTTLYPARFANLIEEATELDVEVVNASCPGYTSFQGKQRLQALWPWEPDIVVAYFGWNDHWKSLNGQTDRDVMQRQMLSDRARTWLGKSRIFWCMYSLRTKLAPLKSIRDAPVRVPLEHYQENLQEILSRSEEHACPTFFVTAPSAYRDGQMPPWSYDFFGQFYGMNANDVSAIPQTHHQYNDVVRQLTESNSNAHLVDVAADWGKESDTEKDPERFRGDRIHLTEQGHQEIAEQLFKRWTELDFRAK